MTEVTIYKHSSLMVWASWRDGQLEIHGQDLHGPYGDEYEYYLTVPTDQLHLVAQDIRADPNDQTAFLQRLVEDGNRIGEMGEATWLKSLGVTAGFSSWP